MLKTIDLASGPNPQACVILLHGLGASADDLVPVAQALELDTIGDVRFVFAQSPERSVTINGGYVMPAWYDILAPFDAPGSRGEDEAGLRQSQALVSELIARETARGLPSRRIVLGGFSQGCAMTLLTGLRHPEPLAGLAGLSGYLPLASTTAAERHPANAKVPVFLGHGRHDPVVGIERGRAAHDELVLLGHPVEWREYPMEHSISLQEIADLNRWLLQRLAPEAVA